jgi:NACalpha-BTF3-like transcription factor
VGPQCTNAMRECKFSNAAYGGTEGDREVLYMLDVCSAEEAAELFPDQIEAALPDGAHPSRFGVVKCGCSQHETDQVVSNRSTLRDIFPGCNPRPILAAPFPRVSKKDLISEETAAFNEFEAQRIRGIVHNGREQEELYLFEAVDVQVAKNSMNAASYRYVGRMLERADARVEQAEAEVAASKREIEKMRYELNATRKTALKALPAETAEILSTYWSAFEDSSEHCIARGSIL